MPSLRHSFPGLLAACILQGAGIAEPGIPADRALAESNLRTLFAKLGSERFEVRERSQAELQKLAVAHRELVLSKAFDTYLDAVDPEIRVRLRSTMFQLVSEDIRAEGFIGIRMMDAIPQRFFAPGLNGAAPRAIQPNEKAVQILSVLTGTAAERAGLRPGDQIFKLDGKGFGEKPDEAYLQLSEYIRARQAGERVVISLRRRGEEMEVDLQLGARPEGLDADRKAEAFEEWMSAELLKRQGGPVATE